MTLKFKKLFSHNHVDQETQKNGVFLVTFAEPKHVVSEQFRTVRTNIEFAGAALDKCQVIMLHPLLCRRASLQYLRMLL